MKTQFKISFSAVAFLFAGTMAFAQSDAEEVPGDNFSLEGALELFKKSASPQEFERLLNSPDSKVNNLDLNGDGNIDYIRVIDKNEGNVHAFIMQSVISDRESQDVAVIELEKRNDGSAVLQIVGDADVYGIETIIEPTEEVRVNAGASTARSVVNVWAWPSVQYVYGPQYSVWVSPWYWGYYPGWYRPWRPIAWYSYDPFWAPYRPYYSVCYRHRVGYAYSMYRPYRSTSVIVYNRHHSQINNFRNTSRGYRYDRGDSHTYGRSRYANDTRSRSSYSNDRNRSSYSGNGRGTNSTERSTSNSRSRDSYRSNSRESRERTAVQPNNGSTNDRSTRPPRSSGSNDRSTTLNSSRPSREVQSQPQRQQAPQQMRRSESPSRQRSVSPAPGQNRSSSPARSNGGGGGSRGGSGGGNGGGHSRRH